MRKFSPGRLRQRMKKAAPQLKQHMMWQIPLTLVFLVFGLLLMAQYNTFQVQSGSLLNESASDLAQIMKSVNDANEQLNGELAQLTRQLDELQNDTESGQSLNSSLRSNIRLMKTVVGYEAVSGSGVSLTITEAGNLIYQDVIDIVNELMNSGAEAVSINNVRFTSSTLISEEARRRTVTVNTPVTTIPDNVSGEGDIIEGGSSSYEQTYYVITINGQELLAPLVIRAIGKPETLEAALTYPGGIIANLTTLYGVSATIRQSAELTIPAAQLPEYTYAAPTGEQST